MCRSMLSRPLRPLLVGLVFLAACGLRGGDLEEVAATAVIERAWVEGFDLYVNYTVEVEPGGGREQRAVHGLFEEAIAHIVNRKDVPIIRLQPADPAVEPASDKEIVSARLMGLEEWVLCWERALDRLAPPRAMKGLKGLLAGYKVVVYREYDGSPQLILASEKPSWIDVDGRISFEEIADEIARSVETYVTEQYPGAEERFLLFRTRQTKTALLPFLALDRELRIPILFTFELPDREKPASSASLPVKALSGTGLVLSSLYHTLIRPVTSLHMLFDALVDVTVDLTYPVRRGRMPKGDPPPVEKRECMDAAAWEEILTKKMGFEESRGTVSFEVGGPAFFEEVMRTMFEAEHSIAIRTYIFDTDDYAASVADILKTRSREVETRIIFDTLGSSMAAGAQPEDLPEGHEAPPSIKQYLKEDSEVEVRLRPNPWFMGDHSKTWILDEKTVYLGGINIGREYRTEWHDMMARVEGPVVDVILDEFNKAWSYSGSWGDLGLLGRKAYNQEPNADKPGYPVRVLLTKPGSAQILKAQLAAMRHAQQRIIVENAYLSSTELINELIRARHRGVDVTVILPEKGNHGVMNANNRIVANHLLDNGIKVYLFPGMSHVKAALYDNWICLGSANFDRLSLRFNMELNVATSHPEAVNELLEELFLPDIEASQQLEAPLKVRSMDFFSRRMAAALL